jgi:hypothetical protein
MAKYVVIGLKGEERLLVLDCEALTVSEVDPAGVAAGDADDLKRISDARRSGLSLVEGVNIAVARSERSEMASFPYLEPVSSLGSARHAA